MTTRKEIEAARDRLREQVSQWTDGAFFQITYRQPLVDLLALLDALLAQEAWREADGICYPDHDGGVEATRVLILPADATDKEKTK